MKNSYYEDELRYLRDVGPEFARANPEMARFLADRGSDPDVERILEGTAFLVSFSEFASGNDLAETGFRLSGLQSDPALVPGDLAVTFIGDFTEEDPDFFPFISQDLSFIQWTSLAGVDPSTGGIARIDLQFVPEPSTAALTVVGLIGLAARRRRP